MDLKFNKDSDSGDSKTGEAAGEKKNQSALLVLLLILVGGFSYLYFFTDLIKPQEVQKAAETVAPAAQVVKVPLPPREGEPAKAATVEPKKDAVPTAAATPHSSPAAPATAAAKPAAVKPAVAKPAAAPTPAVKVADQKTPPLITYKKSGDVATATGGEKKSVTEPKKAVTADKKVAPAKESNKKTASGDQAKPATVVKFKKGASDSWSLIIGNYVLEEALSTEMGRVRKAGFEPIIKPAARKTSTMNRLFVSDYGDRASAKSALEKLSRQTSDAFIIEQGGKFAVYAGSYLQREAAGSEKERLKAAGFATTIKHVTIAIPSQRLSVGPFKSRKSADSAYAKLKSAGIKATFTQQ